MLLVFAGCQSPVEKKLTPVQTVKEEMIAPILTDTICVFNFEGADWEVRVQKPKAPFKGTILLLQGWNFPNTDWCENTSFCQRASEEGYVLVMPDMGKSIYHEKTYEATREDWHKFPTRKWLLETVCAQLKSDFNLFDPSQNNYVMGLSTGGRGALLIAEEHPEIFVAGASLSGDYDQSAFPDDNLYRGYFGTDSSQWNPSENPIASIANWKVPMFIGHGSEDAIVAPEHMFHLRDLVKAQPREMHFTFSLTNGAGHDYTYWASQVELILRFFASNRR